MDNEELKKTLFNSTELTMMESIKAVVHHIFLERIGIRNEKIVVAGGCFTSWLEGKEPKDIDVFVLNSCDAEARIQNKLIGDSVEVALREGDVSYLNNKNIIKTVLNPRTKVQWIFTTYKTRQELVKHFDFLHCCVSYEPYFNRLHISRSTYDAIKNKQLVVNNHGQLVNWRVNKFVTRGWKHWDEDFKSRDPFV